MPKETPHTGSGKWRPQHLIRSPEEGPPTSEVSLTIGYNTTRLEGSASPCCALPATWSTKPGPQGQLGPGVRMSCPAQCILHCMLADCGRLHRTSIGRRGLRAPLTGHKGHCLGAVGLPHSTSDQLPGSLSQDPYFSTRATSSDTFFRQVLCAMGKSCSYTCTPGQKIGESPTGCASPAALACC